MGGELSGTRGAYENFEMVIDIITDLVRSTKLVVALRMYRINKYLYRTMSSVLGFHRTQEFIKP